MDTDSAYMALSGPLHSLVKPELRAQFFAEYGEWFPRPYCDEHRNDFINRSLLTYSGGAEWRPHECCLKTLAYDKRTPGLFKVEFEGSGMVALNSKTYCCWKEDGSSKCSSKGLSKVTNNFSRDSYLGVLRSGRSVSGTNKGFVKKDNVMYTYSQLRTGLTYVYAKRRVLDDGVSTENIDI